MVHRPTLPEEIRTRQPQPVEVPTIEQVPDRYIALGLIHLRNQMANLAKMAEDNSRPVDEYNSQTLAPESETTLTLQPAWEVTEVIRSILVTGPGVGGNFTLQLGDRTWALFLPNTGYILLSPLSLILGRNDVRQLTSNTAGQWTLELMGHCDDRAG